MKLNILFIIAATLLLTACQTIDPDADSISRNAAAVRLTDPEITALIKGKQITLPSITGAIKYFSNGKYEYFQQGFRYKGTYKIANNRACAKLQRGSVTCGEFYRLGNQYYWSNPSLRLFESQVSEIKPI